jgi:hypothetical protein
MFGFKDSSSLDRRITHLEERLSDLQSLVANMDAKTLMLIGEPESILFPSLYQYAEVKDVLKNLLTYFGLRLGRNKQTDNFKLLEKGENDGAN